MRPSIRVGSTPDALVVVKHEHLRWMDVVSPYPLQRATCWTNFSTVLHSPKPKIFWHVLCIPFKIATQWQKQLRACIVNATLRVDTNPCHCSSCQKVLRSVVNVWRRSQSQLRQNMPAFLLKNTCSMKTERDWPSLPPKRTLTTTPPPSPPTYIHVFSRRPVKMW